MHASTSANGHSTRTPRASKTSALPHLDDIALLPCLATVYPAPDTTKAAAVDTFKLLRPSPPVPQLSKIRSDFKLSGREASRIASAHPAISLTVSPFARSAIKKPAICDGVA